MISVLTKILSVTEDKNPADCRGTTPLHQIADLGAFRTNLENRILTEKHCKVISLLLKNVKDIHPKDEDGETPADYLYHSFERFAAHEHAYECNTVRACSKIRL